MYSTAQFRTNDRVTLHDGRTGTIGTVENGAAELVIDASHGGGVRWINSYRGHHGKLV